MNFTKRWNTFQLVYEISINFTVKSDNIVKYRSILNPETNFLNEIRTHDINRIKEKNRTNCSIDREK